MKLIRESIEFKRGQAPADTLKIGDWETRKFEQQLKEFDEIAISNGFKKSETLDREGHLVTYRNKQNIVSVYIDPNWDDELSVSLYGEERGIDLEMEFDEFFKYKSWESYFGKNYL